MLAFGEKELVEKRRTSLLLQQLLTRPARAAAIDYLLCTITDQASRGS